jgi:hypothetical protein
MYKYTYMFQADQVEMVNLVLYHFFWNPCVLFVLNHIISRNKNYRDSSFLKTVVIYILWDPDFLYDSDMPEMENGLKVQLDNRITVKTDWRIVSGILECVVQTQVRSFLNTVFAKRFV